MISRKLRALVARLGLEHPSQLTALDWLDRALLVLMWGGGCLVAARFLEAASVLFWLGGIEFWLMALVPLLIAFAFFRLSCKIPATLATRDPRQHPALRFVALVVAVSLVVVAFARGGEHLIVSLRGEPPGLWSAAFELGLAALGVIGVVRLRERWPNTRLGYQLPFVSRLARYKVVI